MPAEANGKGWILHSHAQGRKFGPLTEDELRSYFRAGMVKSVDRLSAPGDPVMRAAGEVATMLGEAAPVGPPPPEPDDVEATPTPAPPVATPPPPVARPLQDASAEERALRAAAAMNIDLSAMMSSSAPAKKRAGWIAPVLVGGVLVLMLLVALNMIRKMKPRDAGPAASTQVVVDDSMATDAPTAATPEASAPELARQIPAGAAAAAPVATSSGDAQFEANKIKAQQLEAARDWAGLASHASQWAQAQPDRTEPQEFLGVAYQNLGNYAEAEIAFKKVLARAPNDSSARTLLAQTYQQAQRFDEAVPLYKQLVSEKPDDAVAWNNYGAALGGSGQQVQAVAALENAVRLDPGMKRAWTNLGNLYQALGDQTKARAAFANAR